MTPARPTTPKVRTTFFTERRITGCSPAVNEGARRRLSAERRASYNRLMEQFHLPGITPSPRQTTAAALIPPHPTLSTLHDAAASCRACHLWKSGTQTVFGEGLARAKVVLVGEQPGDREDLAGRPFVGPAGGLLDSALSEAGIDRKDAYVTNVVKHFKWEPRGKRRIHKKPNSVEIAACLPWLEAELDVVEPQAMVCLGATAAQALLGRQFKVTKDRGKVLRGLPWAPIVMATVHPSSVLRAPDDETRRRERRRFIEDLKTLAKAIAA